MDNNIKKTTITKRIFYGFLSLLLVFGIGITSLIPISKNKVDASSSPAIINYSDYNISLGHWFYYYMNYNPDKPYSIMSLFNEPMIHIERPENLPAIDTLDRCDVSLSVDSLVRLDDGSKRIESKIYSFTTSHNSQRYRYSVNNVAIPHLLFNNLNDPDIVDVIDFTTIPVDIEINIPVKWANAVSLYDYALICRYLYYKVDNGTSKLNIVYTYENGLYDSDPVMSIYITFDFEEVSDPIYGRYLYDYSVLRIDRSEYIRYVDRVVEKPVYEFTPLNAVKDGVNSFLGIKVLPNFTIGNFLALALGVSFFGFLLHIIIK